MFVVFGMKWNKMQQNIGFDTNLQYSIAYANNKHFRKQQRKFHQISWKLIKYETSASAED